MLHYVLEEKNSSITYSDAKARVSVKQCAGNIRNSGLHQRKKDNAIIVEYDGRLPRQPVSDTSAGRKAKVKRLACLDNLLA